jgi:putative hydrolase of the HAD superfamily
MVSAVADSVRAVTFDVGGTLIEPWPSVGHIYANVAACHGHEGLSAEMLNRRFAAEWRALEDFQHTRSQWAALVDAVFRDLVQPPPSASFFNEVYDRFGAREAWRIYPDVLPTLQALAARGLKLGAVSNWDERLEPLLAGLGLRDFFEVVVVSCELGAPKPSPAIFEAVSSRLALPPEAILHVGDSPKMDFQGARAAGFQAVLLRRQGKSRGAGRIQTLTELCQAPA